PRAARERLLHDVRDRPRTSARLGASRQAARRALRRLRAHEEPVLRDPRRAGFLSAVPDLSDQKDPPVRLAPFYSRLVDAPRIHLLPYVLLGDRQAPGHD